MENQTLKCPACGSERLVGSNAPMETPVAEGFLITERDGEEVYLRFSGRRREAWKDAVVTRLSLYGRVCLDCGHVSLFAADMTVLREAAAKIGN